MGLFGWPGGHRREERWSSGKPLPEGVAPVKRVWIGRVAGAGPTGSPGTRLWQIASANKVLRNYAWALFALFTRLPQE